MNLRVISRNTGMALLVSALFMLLSAGISLLDGGDSAVLVFNGVKINDPENTNERPLADIIYFASAMPQE